MEYRVTWDIEIEANSPREAAEEARAIQLDPDSEAVYYEVYHYHDKFVDHIDLLEDES